jgi:GNAT superfamily N-acetyltransferase
VTVRRLSPSSYWLLSDYASLEPRDPWVREAEDFLTIIAPSGTGDARGSSIVLISDEMGRDVAAAVFGAHHRFVATLIQSFVVHPSHRGEGLALPSFIELRDTLSLVEDGPQNVTWAVREANAPMLSVSHRAGEVHALGDGLVHFVFP